MKLNEWLIFLKIKNQKDVGAYCSAMSSNYNLHAKSAEIIVEQTLNDGVAKNNYIVSRKQDDVDDILKSYTFA